MLGFFKRLFGSATESPASPPTQSRPASGNRSAESPPDPPKQPSIHLKDRSPKDDAVTRRYFELSVLIEEAKRRGDYKTAIAAARETLPLLKRFVDATIRDYGRWDIGFSHAIHTASTLMAVEEDDAAIAELRATLQTIPQLSDWLPVADQAEADRDIVGRIKASIRACPGLLQADLRRRTGVPDGRRMGVLVSHLERAGHIRRVRVGRTYEIYPADASLPASTADAPLYGSRVAPASTPPASLAVTLPISWRGRPPRQPRELDLKRMRIIRLPMAPHTWEQVGKGVQAGAPTTSNVQEEPAFTVSGNGWTLVGVQKLAPEERPDPAFRMSYPRRCWTYWLDPRGRSTHWPHAPSVLQVTNIAGAVAAERGLAWDTYRVDTNVDGSAILFLSRDGVLHGYDHVLQPLLAFRVQDLPEYRACADRLGIPNESLKNHVRCVAINSDHTRYVVTVVDEAWCLSAAGDVLWGLRFPTADRWAPVTRSVDRVGPSSEVMQALELLDVALPVSPEDITRAYRRRALEWHPDRHPDDPSSVRRMQELNAAMALLRGTDVAALTVSQIAQVTMYEDLTSRQTTAGPSGIALTMSIMVGPLHAADWIYAANFGEGRVYLAGYSGRVVEVTIDGSPVRAYDIGIVPRHVAQTSRYLYVLTDTRLYVLNGDQLVALLDVFEQGRLIVADAGLGLLTQKSFTWLSPSGQVIGAVHSRDPIRRTLRTSEGLVIESRQRRALVQGAPAWW